MFISNAERLAIFSKLQTFEICIEVLEKKLNSMAAVIDAHTLASKSSGLKPKKKSKSANWTPERRAQQSERLKAYHNSKKAKATT